MLRLSSGILWALVFVLAAISAVKAEEPSAYDLRSAAFTLPAGWVVTSSSRDQEFDFVSPDGRFELWARWWFPDEPLLGFDDIVRHETRRMAGQDALFLHIEAGGTRTLEVAFLTPDAEGELFLWQLHSSKATLAEHEAMFSSLLAGLTLDGQSALDDAASVPTKAPAVAAGGAMYLDPDGAFGLPLPKGWTVQTTASPGLHQAVLFAPSRDALVIAATARADRGMTAPQVLDEYLGVLYRDSLVIKSIEDEGYPTIAGTAAHAIETIAKVYEINGIAMPYARGRVWIYQSADDSNGRAPFLIVSIRPETASQALTDTVLQVATGFTLDPDTMPTDAPGDAALPVARILDAQDPTTATASERMDKGLLFDGKTLGGLVPVAFEHVTFEENAKLTGNEIAFDFPQDRGWSKLGLAVPTAVVAIPERGSATTQRVTAILDADASTGISFAFLPPANATNDPATDADLSLDFSNREDGTGMLEAMTREPRQSVKTIFAWPKGETVLHLLLRPDQVIDVRDGSGMQLASVQMEADLAGRDWAMQTFVQVNHKNSAASLILKRLSFDRVAFEPVPKLDDIAGAARSVIIFDGTGFGSIWQPSSRRENEVPKYVRLSQGALRVGWTAEDKGSWAGISTPEAALWLDRFNGAAEARVDLALDGAASKDFEIALQSAYWLPGNLTGSNSYVLRFTQQPDGTFSALSALRSQEEEGLIAAALPAIPDRVSLVLSPAGVRVEGAGMPDGTLPFPQLQDGAGLRIGIQAIAGELGDAALVVRGVRVSLRPGERISEAKPQAGVAPLPRTTFFDGQLGPSRENPPWQAVSVGDALFSELASQQPDGLTLRRRDPIPDWNRIALVGSEVVVKTDYRVDTTPYEVVVKLDPEVGLGTRIYMHQNPANHADAAVSVATLRELTSGPEIGGLEVQLHTGHFSYDRWRRILPPDQWRKGWDGTVHLRFGSDSIALGLGDNWLMRGPTNAKEMMMAITPGGAGNTDGGRVTLHSITGGWLTPDAMTARQRLTLIDAQDFDPVQFLDLLNAE